MDTHVYEHDGHTVVAAWTVNRLGHATHGTASAPPDIDLPIQCGCGELLPRIIEYATVAADPDDAEGEEHLDVDSARQTALDRLSQARNADLRSDAAAELWRLVHAIENGHNPRLDHKWDYGFEFGSIDIEPEGPQDTPPLELDSSELDLTQHQRDCVEAWIRTEIGT